MVKIKNIKKKYAKLKNNKVCKCYKIRGLQENRQIWKKNDMKINIIL